MLVPSASCKQGCGWRSQHPKLANKIYNDNTASNVDSGRSSDAQSTESSGMFKLSKSKSSRMVGGLKEDDALSIILNSTKSEWSAAERLEWFRGQVIGDNLEFSTPFGKRQLLYVDHTASGRSLVFIENFIMQYVLPYYGNTHTDDSFVGRRTSYMVHKAGKYVKNCLGGTNNDAILFCGSGCTGALKRLQEVMGVAVPSTLRSQVLETMMEEERWVVFTGPYEHHSNLLSWRQSLAEVVEIPADEDGFIDLLALEAALESPAYKGRRKLGSFSACSNVTGLVTDTRAIARLLHKHGSFACFDFAASAPHVQIDMRSSEKDGYDAVVLSPHKFMGGPNTPGVLLMNTSLYMLGKNPPSTCGGGTVLYVNGFSEQDTLYVRNIEDREDGGTPQIVQKIRCALAFWMKDFIGTGLIEHRESFFIRKAIKRLSANPAIEILGNVDAKRAPILSFLVFTTDEGSMSFTGGKMRGKPLHGRFVVKLLNDLFGIQARGGCACAGPYGHLLLGVGQKQSLQIRSAIKKGYEGLKPGWARLSFSYDMTDEEVEYVLTAIELVAKYGQRFLAMYDFDWKTGDWMFTSLDEGLALEEECRVPADTVMYCDMEAQSARFKHCIRVAKAIAHLLPKYPAPREVPSFVSGDVEMLLFRV